MNLNPFKRWQTSAGEKSIRRGKGLIAKLATISVLATTIFPSLAWDMHRSDQQQEDRKAAAVADAEYTAQYEEAFNPAFSPLERGMRPERAIVVGTFGDHDNADAYAQHIRERFDSPVGYDYMHIPNSDGSSRALKRVFMPSLRGYENENKTLRRLVRNEKVQDAYVMVRWGDQYRQLSILDHLEEARERYFQKEDRPMFEAVHVRQVMQESNFDPYAKSVKNATGLMQLMAGTAHDTDLWRNRKLPTCERFKVLPVREYEKLQYNVPLNIDFGVYTASHYFYNWCDGNMECTLASYNAGPGNVKRYRKFPETRHYVDTLMADACQNYSWSECKNPNFTKAS